MYKNVWKAHAGGCLMIVRINREEDPNGRFEVLGSGFVCHNKGYILTCAHLINPTDELAVIPTTNIDSFNKMTIEKANCITVSIAQFDPVNDLALLRLPNSNSVYLPFDIFHKGATPAVGSSVACLGYPFGNFGHHVLKITGGIISSKVENENGTNQYQIDAMIHESNSGGPLVDLTTNKIIGIVSGRFSPAGGQGGLMLGNYQVGSESSIGLAVTSQYAFELLKAEGL